MWFWYALWYVDSVYNMVYGFRLFLVRCTICYVNGVQLVNQNVPTFKAGLKMSDLIMPHSVCINYTKYFGYVTLYTAFFVIRLVYLHSKKKRSVYDFTRLFLGHIPNRYPIFHIPYRVP